MVRARTRRSARSAGARFERQVADWLAQALGDDRIDRRVKTGAKDRGDITGVRFAQEHVVLECKNMTRVQLPEWMRQAREEAGNDDAPYYAVVHKRHGVTDPAQQWVTLTLEQYARLLNHGLALDTDKDTQ